MPIARSWIEGLPRMVREHRQAVADVGSLVRFRAGTVRRRRLVIASLILSGLTVLSIAIPASVTGAGRADEGVLATALSGFALLQLLSGAASGGGRELASRDQLVAYPVSPTTDHLGALLLAPLNAAWLFQSWLLLGAAAYGVGWSGRLVPLELGVALWIAAATALGQAVGWTTETVRRLRYGVGLVRGLTLLAVAAVATLQLTGQLMAGLHRLSTRWLPTRWLVVRLASGVSARGTVATAALVALLAVAVVLGAVPAHLAARRRPRDELRVESGHHPARRLARSDLAMLLRLDRASAWRAVPMRRGLAVLALGPGLVALAASAPWSELIVLPGLVASGAALLFGVNAWCLDERGGLWRESLPVSPRVVFAARAWVLAEFMVLAALVALLLGALRAPRPTAGDVVAALTACIVVSAQAGVSAMRWSQRHPYAVDLRSARATPAPPLVMVGYSARLAITTALTGIVLQTLSRGGAGLTLAAGVMLLCWQAWRLVRVRDRWDDPGVRARVVTTVAL